MWRRQKVVGTEEKHGVELLFEKQNRAIGDVFVAEVVCTKGLMLGCSVGFGNFGN